jgi:hypothetical protein
MHINGTCNSTLDDLRSMDSWDRCDLGRVLMVYSWEIGDSNHGVFDIPPAGHDNSGCVLVVRYINVVLPYIHACDALHETVRAKTVRSTSSG